MRKEVFELDGHGGVKLPAVLWLPDSEPKQMLQITHGMTEHIDRYTKLAEELTAQGVVVAGFDLRGHGQNPGDSKIASFGEGGWNASMEDMHLFFNALEERFAGIPHFIFGFSLGSFLLREYLSKYPDDVSGAIIMGTGYQPKIVLAVMMAIVKSQIKKAGFDGTTDLVKQLSFDTYNQKFKPNRTNADWLCADEAQLDAYLADPLCRENISAGLFWELLGSMRRTGSRFAYDGWDTDLPILLISGQDDPVGGAGKGVQTVYQYMTKTGMKNVAIHLLPGARHDILHEETCGAAAEAREIIAKWLETMN